MRRLLVALICGFGAGAAVGDEFRSPFPPDLPAAFRDPDVPLVVRVYPVADLVAPAAPDEHPAGPTAVESSPHPAAGAVAPAPNPRQQAAENLAELTVILQSVVEPESWEMSGGPGHVSVHGRTCTLIVRQTEEVHAQIAELLHELRMAASVELQLSCQLFQLTDPVDEGGAPPRVRAEEILANYRGPLNATRLMQLRKELSGVAEGQLTEQYTLSNGGQALGTLGPVTAAATPDARRIRAEFGLSPELGGAPSFECRIVSGHGVLVPIYRRDGEPLLLALVRGTVVHPDEETEQPESPRTASSAPLPLRVWNGVPIPGRSAVEPDLSDRPAPPSGTIRDGTDDLHGVDAGSGIELVAGWRRERRRGPLLGPAVRMPEKVDPLAERRIIEERTNAETDVPPPESPASPAPVPTPAPPAAAAPPATQPEDEAVPLPPPQLAGDDREADRAAEERRIRELLERQLLEQRQRRRPAEADDDSNYGSRFLPDRRPPATGEPADDDTQARVRRSQAQVIEQLRELMARQRSMIPAAERAEPEPGETPPGRPVPPPGSGAGAPPRLDPALERPFPQPRRPLPGGPDPRQGPQNLDEVERHILQAAEHLDAAGLRELAEEVRHQARERLRHRFEQRLREIEEQVERLRREADEIRSRIEPPQPERRTGRPPMTERPALSPDRPGRSPDRPTPPADRPAPPPERPAPPPERILMRPFN